MRSIVVLLALCAICLFNGLAQRPSSTQELSFDKELEGSTGAPAWRPVKGNWIIRDGAYVQSSPEYDCVSLIHSTLWGSFELEATVEQLSGDPGAGFVFHAKEIGSTAEAEMVRFDGGETVLAGYFQDGEFTAVASARSILLAPGSRHRIALRVDGTARTWAFYVDGRPVFDHDLPVRYPDGFAGLQSSAGSVRFRDVVVRRDPGARAPAVGWVDRFTVDNGGAVLLADPRSGIVLRAREDGSTERLHQWATQNGSPEGTLPIASLGGDSVVIADRSEHRLIALRPGQPLDAVGWRGSQAGALDDPASIAANDRGQVFVAERGNARIQVFDRGLRSIATFGDDRLHRPSDVAVVNDRIYVLNNGLSQVECFRWDGSRARWLRAVPYGGGDAHGLAVRDGLVYVSVVNEVRAYDSTGALRATFLGRVVGGITPRGLAFSPGGTLYMGDLHSGRFVLTDSRLTDPRPTVTYSPTADTAFVSWTSVAPGDGSLRLRSVAEAATGRRFPTSRTDGVCTATLAGIAPGSTAHYVIEGALTTWPAAGPRGVFALTTPIAPGTTSYARLRMAAVLFTHVIDDRSSLPPGVAPSAVTREEVTRVRRQIEDAVHFYWMASGMKFFIDLDVLEVSRPYLRKDLYGPESWYPPKEDLLARVLTENGRSLSDYQSYLYLPFVQAYDTTARAFVLGGKGGGFTTGVGTGKGFGISWWDVTKEDHNAGNNWLTVHEFNHQLDDIFMMSAHPEYWFNHISPTIGTAARFGEHFDANGHILRMVPRDEWTDLRFTTVAFARDHDADGLPDDAPSLPSDERRLGSDPTRSDSDGDGVGDLDEVRISNWITEGWGETYAAPALFPALSNADTDGDGLADGADPIPLSPVQAEIRRRESAPEGNLLGRIADARASAKVFAWWGDSSLTVRVESAARLPVKLMLDAGDDGWFLGRGNLLLQATPSSDSTADVTMSVFNATDPTQWPFMDKALASQVRLRSDYRRRLGSHVLTLEVPKDASLGLGLHAGDPIGLLVALLAPVDESGARRYVNLFEPNRFLPLRLSR